MKLYLFLTLILVQFPFTNAQVIIADHTKVDLSLIPDVALSSASALKVVVRRASVGGNIDGGLTAIQTDSSKYNRSNWVFSDRGNPGWEAKINDLSNYTSAHISEYDVFSMKFCWIDLDAIFACYRDTLLQLESRYPTKRFIWWTMPITRDPDGSESNRQNFNDSVRNYTAAHGKFLFDIADIEAYDTAGVEKTDGSGHELQQDVWSSDGGHLTNTGARRVASAWWWLMARVAGWDDISTRVEERIVPTSFTLSQNYPNPFNPATTIEFSLVERSKVTLTIFDILGRNIVTLLDSDMEAGTLHKVKFDASNLSSGIYFYKLEAGKNLLVKKLVLMK